MIMIEGHVFSVCRFGGGNPELLKAMVAGGHLGMNGILYIKEIVEIWFELNEIKVRGLSQFLNCKSSFCDLKFVLLNWMQIIFTFRKKIWERFLCILRKRWQERSKSVKQ